LQIDQKEPTLSEVSQLTWGIVRYAPGTGRFPDEDIAAFDGWYADRSEAVAIYKYWIKRCPGWIVAVVKQDLATFPD